MRDIDKIRSALTSIVEDLSRYEKLEKERKEAVRYSAELFGKHVDLCSYLQDELDEMNETQVDVKAIEIILESMNIIGYTQKGDYV